MTYKLESGENSRQTVVKLQFQTIHPNGLFLYSKGAKTDEYLPFSLTSFMDKCGKCVVKFYTFAV